MIHVSDLIKKYNVPVPRYTSYPPVPAWETNKFSQESYLEKLKLEFKKNDQGISLYIHLPYCESLCTYCGCNTRITVNHAVELPYINALLKEWEMYISLLEKKPVINELHLGGGTPTFFSPENLTTLIQGLKRISPLSENGDFSFEGHPNNTSFGHLKTLRELGFNRVSFGVQDFDEKVQIAINRIQPFENVKRVVDWSRHFNYKSVNMDLVYGLPFQKKESVIETIDKALELSPDRIAFYSYAHVPWVKPGQRKFGDTDVPNDDFKRELFEIGKKKFLDKGYIQIGLDHFAKPDDELTIAFQNHTLHRNFMGYTIQRTNFLFGLGTSSISDSIVGFAQNEKTVEGYLSSIEKGRFPIIKGHLLSDQDLVTKTIVANLMCNFFTHLPDHITNDIEIKAKLTELNLDGLITVQDDSISVTEDGKPFIRNICAVFDSYLKTIVANNAAPVYSKSV